MERKYISPELKIISFSESADVIQTSGELPLATLDGVEETFVSYGTTDFSIFANN